MGLVSPGFDKSRLYGQYLAANEERTVEFRGLNRRAYIEDGEMSDMVNLSADDAPLLSPRKSRSRLLLPDEVFKPVQIIAKYGKLAMLATDENGDVSFWFDNVKQTTLADGTEITGLTESTRMVAINTKICFFPNKTYVEILNTGGIYTVNHFGSLEATVTLSAEAVTLGVDYATIELASGHGFKYDDAISIVGTLTYTPSGGSETTANIDASTTIVEIDSNNVMKLPVETFIEILGEGAEGVEFSGTMSRSMNGVTLDHVIEWNNRLWGASNADNTIYACKLGDPTNWQYFQGTSLDSYYATQGTDGAWSGVGTYSGHIIFFKPNGMCRIYGTAPSNYQITNTKCYGVEDGSALSIVTINDVVYYKSLIGIMAYYGGTPVCISEKLGGEFANVVAGSEGSKYYCAVQKKSNENAWELLVFDIEHGFWLREDEMRLRGTCAVNNRLYAITYPGVDLTCSDTLFCDPYLVDASANLRGDIIIVNPLERDDEWADLAEWEEEEYEEGGETLTRYVPKYETIKWGATFGPFHEYLESKKIYSKLTMRLKAIAESSASVYIKIDDGEWELVKEFPSVSTKGEYIPIIPRRCDRYSIKIEGEGGCEIISLTRHVRKGTYSDL